MKLHLYLSIALSFLFLQPTFASDSQSLEFTGERLLKTSLSGVKTHTEYRTEEVEDTCYREVFSHYENVCRDVPEQQCSYEPRRSCTTIPGRCSTYQGQCRTHCHVVRGQNRCNTVCPPAQTRCEPSRESCSTSNERVCRTTYRTECEDVARYRTESYACMRTVQVPYEVFDYNIEAEVSIEVAKLPTDIAINEKLNVSLNGEDIELSLTTENAELIAVIKSKNIEDKLEGDLKTLKANFVLEVYKKNAIAKELEGIVESSKVQDRKLILSYKLTKILKLESIHLNMAQNRLIGRDLRVFDGEIPKELIKPVVNGEMQELVIDLNSLETSELKNKKYHFNLNFKFGLGENFITETSGLELEIPQNFTQKI